MRFAWDAAKNEKSICERGIDFADMTVAFSGPMLVLRDDRRDYGEARWIGFGEVNGRLMALCWTLRPDETYWIISARKANTRERRRHDSKARPGG